MIKKKERKIFTADEVTDIIMKKLKPACKMVRLNQTTGRPELIGLKSTTISLWESEKRFDRVMGYYNDNCPREWIFEDVQHMFKSFGGIS